MEDDCTRVSSLKNFSRGQTRDTDVTGYNVNGAGKSNSMRISWMNNDETGRWMILLCSRSFYGIFVSLGCYVINFV